MDERKFYLLFGVHNHQPVGNFPQVFEEGYEKAYLPFIEVLEKHPEVKVSLHYSGSLWEWIESKHPDFLKRLKDLLEKGQIEILGGGFYEPLLPLIPLQDVGGQIGMMNDFILQNFSCRPKGFWLTERVWEPHLPTIVKGTGLEYTAIDDTHFFSAGLSEEEVNNYFLTEDQGNILSIFPIDMRLRYSIPFRLPEETIDYLKETKNKGVKALTIFDDGEKFGLWPGTHQWVYKEGWLEKFLKELEKNSAWLTTSTFSEYLAQNDPEAIVYLPTSSYEEMGQWVLSPEKGKGLEGFISYLKSQGLYDEYRPFLKGGFFRNFLRKYPEAKNLYDRMLLASQRLNSLKKPASRQPPAASRQPPEASFAPMGERRASPQWARGELRPNGREGPSEPLAQGLKCLYRGQDNDAYWHGVFGGLYLPHLRRTNYSNLIKAEVITQDLRGEILPRAIEADLNSDGQKEILIETKAFNIFLSPHRGGAIYEMDYRPAFLNLTDIISRREETYHRGIKVLSRNEESPGQVSIHDLEKGISREMAKYLAYDQYTHTTLLEHLLPLSTALSDFPSGRLFWLGTPPHKRVYHSIVREERDAIVVSLASQEDSLLLEIKKGIRIYSHKPELDYEYTLANKGQAKISFLFAVEFCFATPGEPLAFKGRSVKVAFREPSLEIEIETTPEAEWWSFPVKTLSQSATGFELIDQGFIYLPHLKVSLGAKEVLKFQIKERMVKPT